MWTVMFLVVVGAFILTLVSAAGKCPLWVPMLLVSIALLLQILPKG